MTSVSTHRFVKLAEFGRFSFWLISLPWIKRRSGPFHSSFFSEFNYNAFFKLFEIRDRSTFQSVLFFCYGKNSVILARIQPSTSSSTLLVSCVWVPGLFCFVFSLTGSHVLLLQNCIFFQSPSAVEKRAAAPFSFSRRPLESGAKQTQTRLIINRRSADIYLLPFSRRNQWAVPWPLWPRCPLLAETCIMHREASQPVQFPAARRRSQRPGQR